jgi:hypothetical protein
MHVRDFEPESQTSPGFAFAQLPKLPQLLAAQVTGANVQRCVVVSHVPCGIEHRSGGVSQSGSLEQVTGGASIEGAASIGGGASIGSASIGSAPSIGGVTAWQRPSAPQVWPDGHSPFGSQAISWTRGGKPHAATIANALTAI